MGNELDKPTSGKRHLNNSTQVLNEEFNSSSNGDKCKDEKKSRKPENGQGNVKELRRNSGFCHEVDDPLEAVRDTLVSDGINVDEGHVTPDSIGELKSDSQATSKGGSGESGSEYFSVDFNLEKPNIESELCLELSVDHEDENGIDEESDEDNDVVIGGCHGDHTVDMDETITEDCDDGTDVVIGTGDVTGEIIDHDDEGRIEGDESSDEEIPADLGNPVVDISLSLSRTDLVETLQEFAFLEEDDACYSDGCSRHSDIQAIEIQFESSSSEDEDPFGIQQTSHDVEVEVEHVLDFVDLSKDQEQSPVCSKPGEEDEERATFVEIKKLCLEELKRFAHGEENRFSVQDQVTSSTISKVDDSCPDRLSPGEVNQSKISFSDELTSYEWDESKNSYAEEKSENPLLDRLNEIPGITDSRAPSTQITIKLTKTLSLDNLPDMSMSSEACLPSSDQKIPRRKKSKRSPSLKLSSSLCRSITDITKLGSLGVTERDPLFSPGQIRKMLSSTFSSPKNVPRRHVQSLYSPSDDVLEVDHIIRAEGSPKVGKKSPLFERLTNWDGFRKSKKDSMKYMNNTISDPGRVKRRASLGALTSAPLYEEQPNFNQLAAKLKKCDSSASISSTDSYEWDDRKKTISDNIRKRLGNTSSSKKPPDSISSGVNTEEDEALVCQFPDGSEEIVSSLKGKTLREILSPIFDRRNMSMSDFAIFIKNSSTPLKYSFDASPLAGRTLLIQGNHFDAGNDFSYRHSDSIFARSIQDPETPDVPGSERLNRSSSLEMVDSSIKRTHSEKEKHETELSEHSTTSGKAKSITEQLERIKYNLNHADGIPPLEYQNWTELLPDSVIQLLGKREEDQQHHIWELVTTEHNYITTLSTIINTLLGCLRQLHNENYLTKIKENEVFLNIEDIRRVHLTFWQECIVPLIQTTKDTAEPLNPEIFTRASTLFEEEMNPLFEYCINFHESRNYIKHMTHKSSEFKEYINWCNNQIRQQHNKLGIDDMLIKPIQRIQKYPIIIRDILKKTTDDDTKCVLNIFHEKVRVFVECLDRRKLEKEESQKIEAIKERIESYCVLPNSNSSQTNEQINQILAKYNKFDLADKVPLLNTQRKFLHEIPCKMSPTNDAKAQDITLFLFSDHILITRPNKNPKKKNRIIKQPLTLDRVVIEDMKDLSNTNLIVYLNEYGSLVDMFLLSNSNPEAHTKLFNEIIQAKDHYTREKNKLYTELDASKSVSTTSVNSAGVNPYLTTSTAVFRPPTCSITRSSSEHYPPARRVTPDANSSVARAQSMPASNERRNLAPPSIASSSSSSASSSSSSVSEAPSSSDKTAGTLSDIKESDKSTESGTEDVPPDEDETVTSEQPTLEIIPTVVKTIDSDVYLSDNLNTEFSTNIDLNRGVSECGKLNDTDSFDHDSEIDNDKVLLSNSDALFIDHHHQSES